MNVKYFFYKSKDSDDLHIGVPNWRKVLSNFWVYDQGRFPSIEYEFQYMKYLYSDHPEEADKIDWGAHRRMRK